MDITSLVPFVSFLAALAAVIAAIYKLVIWLKSHLNSKIEVEAASDEDNIATRFIQLFEAHGVHRNQIPEFFGHGLLLADVQSDEALLKKLSPSMLKAAVSLFQVNAEWMDHGKGEVFPQHDFYKRPASFGRFIEQLKEHNPDKHITGYVLTEKPPYEHKYDTLILLKEEIGAIGERTIYRYHFCPDWIMRYWKCRVDLACCIAQAQMHKVWLIGKYVDFECIRELTQENQLPTYDFESGGLTLPYKGRWSVGDYVDIPATLVRDLDGEESFGGESAVHRWLKYYDEGLMYNVSDVEGKAVRAAFENYLAARV